MDTRQDLHRPGSLRLGERLGYTAAATVNLVLLYLIYAWPGWDVVPFLTERTPHVLGPVALSLVVGVAVNLAFSVGAVAWFTAYGRLLGSAVAWWSLVRIWAVFPFTFADDAVWRVPVRLVLAVALVGTAIDVIAQATRLVRELRGGGRRSVGPG
ncbi:hypothetical protein Val02_49540 [Virgisporangium aliadipatigenens]|uniref:Uncharacterized protein n=1 Tax=Virgisporangium aliadipatigenens TaxID=741659 RepID=A0A8J3YQQ5_9ACTN|nr:hypothetical protein [Virgisporangium aliadipatigenens]GIJ48068.1 hypothetical protein Val02_49540 [Virgisporangium aliadipatigenens]